MASKIVTVLVTITIIALAASTAAVSSTTTIAKAQSENAMQHACPAGTISSSQGQCIVQTTTTVPRICPTPPGTTSQFDPSSIGRNLKCTVTFPDNSVQSMNTCLSLGGHDIIQLISQYNPPICLNVPQVCPPGYTITNTGCITTTTMQNKTTSIGTNFTQLLAGNKEFQSCSGSICVPTVDVVYQGPIMLLFKSGHIDTIWKAVELAKKKGYKIDGMSTYTTTSQNLGGGTSGTVNTLVAMSKG